MKKNFQKLFNWERWSYDAIYVPIVFFWFWFALKARSFWYFTPVNPSLIFSGFEGGSKKEMYEQLPTWSYPTTIYVNPEEDVNNFINQMLQVGLNFPVVVKPDSGMGGVLFRIITNEFELKNYHSKVGELYVLQQFIDDWPEFSVYYIRYPDEKKGVITGLILKDYLHVIGNGIDSLTKLVDLNAEAKYRRDELKRKHEGSWNEVLSANEKFYLSRAGNHGFGAKFINLKLEIDQQLCDVFDNISNEAGQFYFGRYDLKCTSLEDLKVGNNIQILEFNGAGAAITHIFDSNMSYFSALREIIKHWRHLYKIGKINNKKGVPYWSFIRGYRFMQHAKKNFKRLKKIDQLLN